MAKKPVFLRRCHLCGHITQNTKSRVERCKECGKHMSKYYYYDELKAPIYAENLPRPSSEHEYQGIIGISVTW